MILSLRDAAREEPARLALVDEEGHEHRFADLAEAARAVPDGDPDACVVLEPRPRLADVVRILALIDRGRPMLLVDPDLPLERRAQLTSLVPHAVPWRRWAQADAPRAKSVPDDDRPLALLATSGTSTGAPRVVELSRAAFAAAARGSARHLGVHDDDLWGVVLPLFHVGGLSILVRSLAARRAVALFERFESEEVASRLARHRVTLLSLVPAMLARLLALPAASFPPGSLRAVLVGGDATAPSLLAAARARGVPVLATYGMTETCAQVATQRPDDPRGGLHALPGVELRVVGKRIEVGGPTIATRAFDETGARPLRDTDGFHATADAGELRDDGTLVVLGRLDDVVVSGGKNVAPAIVEAALETLPAVARALVVGLEDDAWGRVLGAVLVAPSGELSASDARSLAERLAPHEWPRRLAFVDALPATSTGKPDRAAARALLAAEGRPFSRPR